VAEDDSDLAAALYAAVTARAQIIVPLTFFGEVANAIRRKAARGLITNERARQAYQEFGVMRVTLIRPPDLYERAFDLAVRYALPANYDSLYVALAVAQGCDLWTADSRLFNTFSPDHPNVRLLASFTP
jgi:predicted nucleic acid-binding protein